MAVAQTTYQRLLAKPEAAMLAALVAATVALLSAAVIGGRHAQVAKIASETTNDEGQKTTDDTTTTNGATGPTATASSGGAKVGSGGSVAPGAAAAGKTPAAKLAERTSTVGATREGVHGSYFEFGTHAPVTLDGAPLPLAEDPITGIKGYVTYVNRHGGVNGLKVRLFLIDDRYTVQGGQQAADQLVKEIKPFFISGTLGIDQIAKVAAAAGKAKIPYFAGGGPEPEFKNVGMYETISNYDQYMDMTVQFICKFGVAYVGGKTKSDVRLGTTTLQSENILPVEKRFVTKLTKSGCVKTPVDPNARGTIRKPTEQSTYTDQQLKLQGAYGGAGANLIVPLQDPISTARQAAEWAKKGYRPKWTGADFAHDSDTALELVGGEWSVKNPSCPGGSCLMRWLSGACYYHPSGGADPYNPNKCAKMGEAHKEWDSLGHVDFDENAGGDVGGKSSYDYTESNWEADGSGGATGYHLIYYWYGAMKSIGTDPTREKFFAALNAYDHYSNLLTGPITYKGSPNRMIGATRFVMLEARDVSTAHTLKWRQVANITPGLVDHF